jgi:hypothetical protein
MLIVLERFLALPCLRMSVVPSFGTVVRAASSAGSNRSWSVTGATSMPALAITRGSVRAWCEASTIAAFSRPARRASAGTSRQAGPSFRMMTERLPPDRSRRSREKRSRSRVTAAQSAGDDQRPDEPDRAHVERQD